MMIKEQNPSSTLQRARQAVAVLGCAALMLAFLGFAALASSAAYAASSAEQKGQAYSQQDPGYEAAEESSGTTQYYLDIEKPKSSSVLIDTSGGTSGLPKTGDDIDKRLVVLVCGCVAIVTLVATAAVLWPRKGDDDESENAKHRV